MEDKVKRAGRLMYEEFQNNVPFSMLEENRPEGIDEAYAIQNEYTCLQVKNNSDSFSGYKIAFTTDVMQKHFGMDQPAYGRILTSNVFESPHYFNSADFSRLGVECEIAITIGKDISLESDEINKKSLAKVESLLKVKTPRLITVSRFDKRKNHEKVIMAIRNLKQIYPDIVYICIGYGDEEENLKKLVEELNLGSQVMFFKDITDDLKYSLIAKSHIFVMPSIIHKKSVEGFGIAYVEAAQYGVPSLGGKDGGASDAIEHDRTGLICDGNNLDDIYSSLNSMIENNKYHVLGKNAKEYVSKFQWDKIIDEYKKILN